MKDATATAICTGCGARVDPLETAPFRCPAARNGDGIDHVLVRRLRAEKLVASDDPNPYIRYRHSLLAWHVGKARGLGDRAWIDLVRRLDDKVAAVAGVGFRITPLKHVRHSGRDIVLKDETGNVSGSHKARHLMAILLYLETIGAAPAPLAIASCGNAALAAAVLAKAAGRPLRIFIPPDAEPAVVAHLRELDANITICKRETGVAGDPCVHAFRAAVASGAIPFSTQGNENGLCIEGGHSLGWEMAEFLDSPLDDVVVQVGGGALASAVFAGLSEAVAFGDFAHLPRLHTVQTLAVAPFGRARQAFVARFGHPAGAALDAALNEAAKSRVAFMRPWSPIGHSAALGILDDETYDWLAILRAVASTGGTTADVDEIHLVRARAWLTETAGIRASSTGAAGAAFLFDEARISRLGKRIGIVVTGRER